MGEFQLGDSGLRGRGAVPAGGFWVERARGSASRSASAVSKSSLLFERAEKSARGLELSAATRIGIYVKLEECQARTGGIQFQRSFPGTFQAAVLLQMQNTPGWNIPRPRHIIPSKK